MPAHDPAHRAASARLAITRRWHPEQDTTELERDLRAARLTATVRRALDARPPLTGDQRARVAALLLGETAESSR